MEKNNGFRVISLSSIGISQLSHVNDINERNFLFFLDLHDRNNIGLSKK